MPSFGVAIVTYNGLIRVRTLLQSMQCQRDAIDYILIAEDPCPYDYVHKGLLELAQEYDATLLTGNEWGCMQGNAARAMDFMPTDVVALLSDDVILTAGCLRAHREMWEKYWHFPIGAAQIPYWGNWSDVREMGHIAEQGQFYTHWRKWIDKIPNNKHWDFDGFPRIYVNVHGCGFSLRKDVWNAVGGFSPETWSYDEDIAARIWLFSPNVCVAVPGPPMVHFGGASQCGNEHPDAEFHTLGAWIDAWGYDKPVMHVAIQAKMRERAYLDELFRMQRPGSHEDLKAALKTNGGAQCA